LFRTASSHRIYNRTEKALLRDRIHQTRRELAWNDKNLYSLHLQLSYILTTEDWTDVDRMTHATMTSTSLHITDRLKKKYENSVTTKAP
ncbi:hypothetical protein ANN_13864, partial [Periplaneta americana]